MEHQQAGICPKCGSELLRYGVLEPMGDSIYYPCECIDCGCKFKEWYNLEFNETVME